MKSTAARVEIIAATVADVGLVAGLIAAAFHDDAAAAWQIPDENQRRALFPGIFEEYVYHALGHGAVEITTDLTAAAVWTVETGTQKPAPEPPRGLLADALGEALERVNVFDLALHEREPIGERFEKLALLAVRPGHQRQGHGSQLLTHHLADLDRRLVPAYLEASSEASRELYRHFGFREHGEPITLPDGPQVHPMWREPLAIQRS